MRCKHCGKEVGEFFSELETHLWDNHRSVMMTFLGRQSKKSLKRSNQKVNK